MTVEELNALNKGTLMESLDIVFTETGEDYIVARMPVNHKTIQPWKLLHGGATMALMETAGGALSAINTNLEEFEIRGLEINANHVCAAAQGYVYGKASFIHKGRRTHVSEIKVTDDDNNLISSGRITVMIIEKQ